jgi:glutaredoxin-like protein NrdH
MKGLKLTVTVYTLPSCVQCDSTKKVLQRNEIPFNEIDLSINNDAMEMVKALGYASAPVVIAGEEHWAGFRPDKLSNLAA